MDADYHVRTRTQVTTELVVKLPLDWKNLGFILHRVTQEMGDRAQYDDACTVTADEEELVFSWPSKNETVPDFD